MAKLGDLIVRIGGDTRGLNTALGNVKKTMRGTVGNFTKLGRSMSMSVTAPLMAIAASSFKVAADFEQSMAKVKAVSGATGAEFKKLEDNAKALGSSTRFTASEVSALQLEYAKLGFSSDEITQVTEATLNLAQATGSDLAQSAEVAGATLRGFGLDASETQRVTDVMAESFSSSALDMSSFQASMKYVAPVAKAAGVSIEETTAMLARMADSGIKGSQAGTSLRMIFQQLASGGGDVTEKLSALASEGLTLDAAFDEVGRRAQTALLVLGENEQKTTELTTAFENSTGAAKAMADIMDDTAEGSMKRMASAIEGAQIALGTALAPVIEKVAGFIGDLARKFTNMSEGAQTTIAMVGGIVAAIGPLLIVLPNLGMAIGALVTAMTGPVGLIILGISAIVAAFFYFYDDVKGPILGVANFMIQLYNESALLRGIIGGIKGTVKVVFGFFAFAIDSVIASFMDLGTVISAVLAGDFSSIPDIIADSFAKSAERVVEFGKKAAEDWRTSMEGELQREPLELLTDEDMDNFKDRILDLIPDFSFAGTQVGEAISEGIVNGVASSSIQPQIQGVSDSISQMAENLEEGRKEFSMMIDLSRQAEAAFMGIGLALGGLISGTMDMASIFSQAIMGLANLLIGLGQQFIAAGVAASVFFASLIANPLLAIGAGVALVAAGAIIQGLGQKNKGGVSAFAEGGIVSGPTMGLVGEYPGAKTNPEVIAPLDKLRSMLGGQSVVVTGKISGRDILLTSERNAIDRNRVRGY